MIVAAEVVAAEFKPSPAEVGFLVAAVALTIALAVVFALVLRRKKEDERS